MGSSCVGYACGELCSESRSVPKISSVEVESQKAPEQARSTRGESVKDGKADAKEH